MPVGTMARPPLAQRDAGTGHQVGPGVTGWA